MIKNEIGRSLSTMISTLATLLSWFCVAATCLITKPR
ncbi:hypothetical protein VEx25_2216 [Vibrio antiquarius]|uniref:Lipoprotein n=1 Tax=Vibrio antiquarius (strain Ex25) TaxID=150340 RepID=A0ABM9WSK7_VIBAE|nr:hypothetical protein VEx25_2216 [Vibrio antiquarius]